MGFFDVFKKKSNIQVNPIKKQATRADKKSYIIEFPFYGVRGDGDLEEEVYYSGEEAYKWFDKETATAISGLWDSCNMKDFIEIKQLKNKIDDIQLFVCTNGTCKVVISVFEELNEEEKAYILEFVSGQASDGWGEGGFLFKDSDNKDYQVYFWSNDDSWYIKFVHDDIQSLLFEKYKQLTEKECYEVELVEEKTDIKDNKMGGCAYIPVGEEYPKDKLGKDMPLLLQVNLKDIDLEGFPKDGILEFFTSPDFLSEEYVVKYYQDDLEYQTLNAPKIDADEFVIRRDYKLKLNKVKCHMPFNDYRACDLLYDDVANDIVYNALQIDKNCKYSFNKVFGNINCFDDKWGLYIPKICIGGYADFTQEDPRDGVIKDKDECLLKIDSLYDASRINIGDCGIFFSLISGNDLKEKKFGNAYTGYDCH